MDKKTLSRYRFLKRDIKQKKELINKTNSTKKNLKLESEIKKEILLVREIEKYIKSIKDPYIKQIFEYRFINGLGWQSIAIKLGQANNGDFARKIVDRHLSRF